MEPLPESEVEATALEAGVEVATALDNAAFEMTTALDGKGVGVVVGIS